MDNELNKELAEKAIITNEIQKPKLYDFKVKIMFFLSIVFILIGFFKRFVYEYSEYSYSTDINAYVGGDAYNFIINSNQMIAYFVLALLCVVIACTFLIVNTITFSRSIK